MNNLTQAIKDAMDAKGNPKEANKAYLEFIKANFIIPIEKHTNQNEPVVLFMQENENKFLPVFTEMSHLVAWANEINEDIQLLKLSGVDLLKGLGENVTVCLDIGSHSYKEFTPAETARMKSIVLKLFKKP